MTFDQWHKKYLAASGNPFKDEAWLLDRFNRGNRPIDAAADSRWIFPCDFDAFLARARVAIAAEVLDEAPLFAKGVA